MLNPETASPSPRTFLPDCCGKEAVFTVVIGGGLLALLLVLGSAQYLEDPWTSLGFLSLYVQWIGLLTLGLWCLSQRWLIRLGDTLGGLTAWALAMLVTLGVSETTAWLFAGFPEMTDFAEAERGMRLLQSLGISAVLFALALRYLYLNHRWRLQLQAEAEARLQALQARIRPHFLFNSINTLASLIRSQPLLAEDLLSDMADLFRASLTERREASSLGAEIELTKGYLHIEQQRLGDRLRVEWDIEELPRQAKLPLLILQPLVENAVYHGVEPSLEPGPIRILGRYRHQQVNISIGNSLPPSDSPRRSGNRLAVDNIRQRLQTLFGHHASLEESRVDGQYQVRLVFPHPWIEA